jgi:hypothetical protein
MISDETFFAWLDGELEPAEAAAIDAMVAADPNLRQRAAEHRALQGSLHDAFDSIADAPLPGRLLTAARQRKAEVIDLAVHRGPARPISVRAQWAAMAATLVIGIIAGSLINGGPSTSIAREDGRLVATAALEHALYTRLASAPVADGPRIGLTFRDAAGNICRSFTDDGASGLACHEGGDWRIRGLFQAGEGQQSQFRMAAGPDPRLGDLIDSTIAGEPLDAVAERQAIHALR